MSVNIQMIHIHYRGKFLSLLDSDDSTPLYTVKVCREMPQVQLMRRQNSDVSSNEDHTDSLSGLCTSSFKKLSMEVTLSIRGHRVLLRRPDILSRTYRFEGLSMPDTVLQWEADGALTGDFKLVNTCDCQVLCRFHNKVFSVAEVGSFEMIGMLSEELKEEIVISGLAVLVMLQSLNLAGMVLMGNP
ncbi:uncharacterized protein N7496_002774 [Penicillium cataractarum]|uniref:Uncharacterized protein n=1 Tax=Penicillium cataractarum TaxID=2100454 RepID=A0A9W9SKR3_9EURO|nr:uncharacterized protein N7496_002774 [Penicillium cataractarum]KAJ5380346.1 hypothetical protein N7496_002774 [Penicillium cataractarum]